MKKKAKRKRNPILSRKATTKDLGDFALGVTDRMESLTRRVAVVEPLLAQLLAEQKPLLEELYRARQGALSVMQDLTTLKAIVHGGASGWTAG